MMRKKMWQEEQQQLLIAVTEVAMQAMVVQAMKTAVALQVQQVAAAAAAISIKGKGAMRVASTTAAVLVAVVMRGLPVHPLHHLPASQGLGQPRLLGRQQQLVQVLLHALMLAKHLACSRGQVQLLLQLPLLLLPVPLQPLTPV